MSCDAVAANKAFHEKFDFAFPLLSVWKSTSVSGALLGDDAADLARSSGEEAIA